MNEQIKKLAVDSGLIFKGGDILGRSDLRYEEKQFAQAIIQQCITQIALVGISNFENDDHGDIGWTTQKSIEMIKRHFGILND